MATVHALQTRTGRACLWLPPIVLDGIEHTCTCDCDHTIVGSIVSHSRYTTDVHSITSVLTHDDDCLLRDCREVTWAWTLSIGTWPLAMYRRYMPAGPPVRCRPGITCTYIQISLCRHTTIYRPHHNLVYWHGPTLLYAGQALTDNTGHILSWYAGRPALMSANLLSCHISTSLTLPGVIPPTVLDENIPCSHPTRS
jgi:hypothetical protein